MEEVGIARFFAGGLVFFMFVLAMIALIVVIWCQIFKKAGYHPAMGLLMLVPVANIVMLFILAFAKWPVYEKLSQSVIIKEE